MNVNLLYSGKRKQLSKTENIREKKDTYTSAIKISKEKLHESKNARG